MAKERLIAEETKMKDRVMEKNLPEMSAFQGKKKWKFNGKCFKCGKVAIGLKTVRNRMQDLQIALDFVLWQIETLANQREKVLFSN